MLRQLGNQRKISNLLVDVDAELEEVMIGHNRGSFEKGDGEEEGKLRGKSKVTFYNFQRKGSDVNVYQNHRKQRHITEAKKVYVVENQENESSLLMLVEETR